MVLLYVMSTFLAGFEFLTSPDVWGIHFSFVMLITLAGS